MLALLVSLLCCGHVGAPRASVPVLLPDLSPVTFQYEHGSSVREFVRTNPGAELAHWRDGQRACANSAEFQTTEAFTSMAHSSDDDDDYSLPGRQSHHLARFNAANGAFSPAPFDASCNASNKAIYV